MRRSKVRSLAAVIAGALILVCALPAAVWLAREPYLGLLLERSEGAVIVAGVEGGSTAERGGIRPGDELLAIGDVQTADRAPTEDVRLLLFDVLNRYQAGDRAEWQVRRDAGLLSWSAVFAPVPRPLIATHILVYAVAWIVAFSLLGLRRHEPVVVLLTYTVIALTAGNFLRPVTDMALNRPMALVLNEVCAAGRFLGPALIVHFGVDFPVSSLSPRARRNVLRIGYGLPFLLFLVEQSVIMRGVLSDGAPYLIYTGILETIRYWEIRFWVFLGSFAACGLLILQTYRKLRDRQIRDQIKWVLWGTLSAVALDALVVALALYVVGAYSDYALGPYRNLIYLLMQLGLILAILRHDLFDVDRVIRGSVVYFVTAGLLFVVFAAAEEVVSKIFAPRLPAGSGFASDVIAGVLVAALFIPVRHWIESLTQSLLPRETQTAPKRGG